MYRASLCGSKPYPTPAAGDWAEHACEAADHHQCQAGWKVTDCIIGGILKAFCFKKSGKVNSSLLPSPKDKTLSKRGLVFFLEAIRNCLGKTKAKILMKQLAM